MMFTLIYLITIVFCTEFCIINKQEVRRLWDGQDFLLAADYDTITSSLIENGIEHKRLVEECRGIVAIDYIYADRTIIWAEDTTPPRINIYQNDTSEFWFFTLRDGSDIKSMATDWVSKNIYWFDNADEAIKVCSLVSCTFADDGEPHRKSCSCKTLALKVKNQKRSHDLVIDIQDSRLFFMNDLALESMNLDGSDRKVKLNATVVGGQITALAMAGRNTLIYSCLFTDPYSMHSWSSTYQLDIDNGTAQEVEHPLTQTLLLSSKNFLLQDVLDSRLTGLSFILSMTSLSPSLQLSLPNSCENSACSDLCLSSSTGFTCACPSGLALESGSSTRCRANPQSFIVLAKNQVLGRISLDTEEHEYLRLVQYADSSRSFTAVAIDPANARIYYYSLLR